MDHFIEHLLLELFGQDKFSSTFMGTGHKFNDAKSAFCKLGLTFAMFYPARLRVQAIGSPLNRTDASHIIMGVDFKLLPDPYFDFLSQAASIKLHSLHALQAVSEAHALYDAWRLL
ncbi:hypothetical protein NDU88_007012 [Pleurodeles waltl]|uniref:Uncharacterized protein n=1 Tax=Pleurodeles waltl TaxID=8319 RepID=A0AAV7QKH0_PLEWA|nr:hypothetical protein NDU88_007012 [Pleurodeles waltl]